MKTLQMMELRAQQLDWRIDDLKKEIMDIKKSLLSDVDSINTETKFFPDSIVNRGNRLCIVTMEYQKAIEEKDMIARYMKEMI